MLGPRADAGLFHDDISWIAKRDALDFMNFGPIADRTRPLFEEGLKSRLLRDLFLLFGLGHDYFSLVTFC